MAPKPGGGAPERKRGRTAKACVQCRATKTRCTFLGASTICDKCIQRGLNCSMLPPGQRVSARERSPSQPQLPERVSEETHSQSEPSNHGSQPRKPEIPTNISSQATSSSVPSNNIVTSVSDPLTTPASHWPPSITSTPPQQQGVGSNHWQSVPQLTGTPQDGTGSASLKSLNGSNGRNSMPHLQHLATTSPAVANVIHSPHALPAVSPSDMTPHQPQGAHIPYQRQQQQQQQQQQYQPVQFNQSYQPQHQHLCSQPPQTFQQQAYPGPQYEYHPQHTSVSENVSHPAYVPSVYLSANSSHLEREQDVPLRPVMDNINIVQSIMRTENLRQSIDLGVLSERAAAYIDDPDPLSHQPLSSTDIRAIINADTFGEPAPDSVSPPINIDTAEIMDLGDDYMAPSIYSREFLGGQDASEDILKVDDNIASNAFLPSEDLLHALAEIKHRSRYQISPEFTALQLIDPALRMRFGQASKLLRAQPRVTTRHLLTIGLLSRSQVVTLLSFFRNNFNHWIGLPTELDADLLLDTLLAKCPLLVTAACCVALRLCHRDVWMRFYPVLVNFLNAEFAATLLESPQNFQFIQAITIMAFYADSLSYNEYVFDGWYLSGLGIQQLVTLGALTNSLTHVHLRLWNHLCMANLSYSVMTGRHTVVTGDATKACRRILVEPHVDRFDICVVAEIELFRCAFRYFSFRKSFSEFEDEIAEWKKEWNFLNFSLVQFVQPMFLFLCFIVRWSHTWRLDQGLSPTAQNGEFTESMDAANAIDGVVSAATASAMSTETLVSDLNNLTMLVKMVLDSIHELYFGFLSDQQHNLAFTASIMSLRVRELIIHRNDESQETKTALADCLSTTRRLAERLQASSRGPDLARMQSYALLRLLQSAPNS